MAQSVPMTIYNANPLQPVVGHDYKEGPVNLPPNSTILAGTVLGAVTAAANDVQTITLSSTGAGDSFVLTGYNPITGVTFNALSQLYNVSTANLQAELVKPANFGAGNVVVSGSAGTSYALTFGGALASMVIPPVTAAYTSVGGGGSAAVVHTTTGATAGTYAPYSSATLAAPAAAPTLTAATGTSPGAGTWSVAYTALNAQGETTISPIATVTVTGSQKFTISSTALPTGATGLNWYVSAGVGGPLVFYSTQSSAAAQDVVAAPTATNHLVPRVNTAYAIVNGAGTQVATALMKYSAVTDSAGLATYGSSPNSGGEWGFQRYNVPAFFNGVFNTADLIGLDATAVSQLGRLWNGTTTSGRLKVI